LTKEWVGNLASPLVAAQDCNKKRCKNKSIILIVFISSSILTITKEHLFF